MCELCDKQFEATQHHKQLTARTGLYRVPKKRGLQRRSDGNRLAVRRT